MNVSVYLGLKVENKHDFKKTFAIETELTGFAKFLTPSVIW